MNLNFTLNVFIAILDQKIQLVKVFPMLKINLSFMLTDNTDDFEADTYTADYYTIETFKEISYFLFLDNSLATL